MKKVLLVIFLFGFSLPYFANAQSNRFEELRGNRNILTVEEAEKIGEDTRPANNNKTALVLGVIVFLGLAGYATVQLVGMYQKPKIKDDN